MLYRLEIENFYSIRDLQVIDLAVDNRVAPDAGSFEPIFPDAMVRAPKVVVLFGANASGKTTVLKALSFLRWFVLESFQAKPELAIPVERFNDEESSSRDMRFAIEFGGPLYLLAEPGQGPYGTHRYELCLRVADGVVRRVRREAFRSRLRGEGKWRRVFERAEDGTVKAGKSFGLSGFRSVIGKVRAKTSLIATLAQFEHGPSLRLREAATRIISNVFVDRIEPGDGEVINWYMQNPDMLAALNREVERIDLGINAVKVVQGSGGPALLFEHHGLGQEMPWLLESHGTRSFMRCFPLLLSTLLSGGIALVDEIDASIHPVLLPEIVRWFRDPSRNPSGAQLWATCHNASLLEELVKEEVLFCDKDARGRTHVYGLADIQGVRRDENQYKRYLSGVYGGVPRVG